MVEEFCTAAAFTKEKNFQMQDWTWSGTTSQGLGVDLSKWAFPEITANM